MARGVEANPAQTFWFHAMEGEIALAEDDPGSAVAAFVAGEPQNKMFFDRRAWHTAVFSNNLPFRDGLARARAARGDLEAAIETYRDLLAPARSSNWTSWLEPRHVLELARMFHRAGDNAGARIEYERFLDLWKSADPELPEVGEARAYLK